MIRYLIYAAILFALAAGFAWLADNPGELEFQFQDFTVRTTVMTAAVVALGALVVARLMWLLGRWLFGAPRRIRRQMADRRRDHGQTALSKGFIAIGSGDRGLAAHYAAESRHYLPHEPMTMLLGAQTAQLGGDEMGARAVYEEMLANPETRVLGLRGLFTEARRRNDDEAARSFAEVADAEKPGLPWAGSAVLEFRAADRDWDGALETLSRLAAAGAIEAERAKRLQAVLLTAKAMELEDGDPSAAREAAIQAHRIAPELVPAATIASRLHTRLGDPKRAAKAVETTWRIEPHPDLAEAYADARPGESGRERLKQITHLTRIRANHAEGQLAMARAAIDAQEWETAREELRSVIATRPSERACLLMAELEERERHDVGRARDWLNRAVRAPRDPAWVADGYVFDHWEPVSPISGRLDAFEWKVPAVRLEAPDTEPDIDLMSEDGTNRMAEDRTGTDLVLAAGEPSAETYPTVAAPQQESVPEPAPEEAADPIESGHQPDDPGPEPEAEPAAAPKQPEKPARRFRLFSS